MNKSKVVLSIISVTDIGVFFLCNIIGTYCKYIVDIKMKSAGPKYSQISIIHNIGYQYC